jgi:hypothetical protein
MPKLNLFLSSDNAHISDSCELLRKDIGLIRKEQTRALKLLLCNLCIHTNQSIRVSRSRNSLGTKRGNPLSVGFDAFRKALDTLESGGYIIQDIGSKLENKQTTIITTPKLVDWFHANSWTEDDIGVFDGQYVKLRLNEDKRSSIDYEDTDYSRWLSSELENYSNLLNRCDLHLMDEDGNLEKEFKNHCIARAFIKHKHHPINGEFLFGGRMAPPWVNLSQEARKRIMINGEPTVELDRPASHINAMYEVVTGKPYQDGYPYELFINDSLVPKHIVKNLASFMQGSKSPLGTAISVGNHYKREAAKPVAAAKDTLQHEEWLTYKKKVSTSTIIDKFLNKHSPVKDYYMRGKQYGDRIQCWESDIVFEVVIELVKRRIPVLTVYDSFIIQLRHSRLLKELMENVKFTNRRRLESLA